MTGNVAKARTTEEKSSVEVRRRGGKTLVFREFACAEGSPVGVEAVLVTRRLEIEALIVVLLPV
jgi:hypothetical protein